MAESIVKENCLYTLFNKMGDLDCKNCKRTFGSKSGLASHMKWCGTSSGSIESSWDYGWNWFGTGIKSGVWVVLASLLGLIVVTATVD